MEFNAAFDHFFSSPRPMFSLSSGVWSPPADVFETDEELVVKLEVGGMRSSDFDITIRNNLLVVRGCRMDCHQACQVHLHNVEVRYGRFERAFEMVGPVDAEAIRADYEQGFLIVHVPKRIAPPKSISIAVETD
ncbi:MAG: Hsp20/alpha crystallin family protein [Candidatus Sumerlaeota bacterium]|nr:Hsp20/alpha crystallin family protein [Candidatus Sumerlaeota bacterium]